MLSMLCVVWMVCTVVTGTYVPLQNVTDPVPSKRAEFGSAVAASKDNKILVVGTKGKAVHGLPYAGVLCVFLFEVSQRKYVYKDRLQAPVPQSNGYYGRSATLSYDGVVLAVATYAPPAVHVYNSTQYKYAFRQTVEIPGNPNSYCVYSTTLSDSALLLFAGCIGDESVSSSGVLHLFHRVDVTSQFFPFAIMRPPDVDSGFGGSAALSLDSVSLAVGSAKVYVYRMRDAGPSLQQVLHNGTSVGGVAFSSDNLRLMVGDHAQRRVRMYARGDASNNFTFSSLIESPTTEDNLFGCALSLTDSILAVGALSHEVNGKDYAGTVFVYSEV